MQGFSDSYWVGSAEDRKITSICCFNLGSVIIYWMSRKQTFVSLSTIEAKYIAASLACCEEILIQKVLERLFY